MTMVERMKSLDEMTMDDGQSIPAFLTRQDRDKRREPYMTTPRIDLDQEVSLGETLQQAVNSINKNNKPKPDNASVASKTWNKTMLQSIAEAFLDLRYEEMMTLAAGIQTDPSNIHTWAKNYTGE
jgi:hypothetical protein